MTTYNDTFNNTSGSAISLTSWTPTGTNPLSGYGVQIAGAAALVRTTGDVVDNNGSNGNRFYVTNVFAADIFAVQVTAQQIVAGNPFLGFDIRCGNGSGQTGIEALMDGGAGQYSIGDGTTTATLTESIPTTNVTLRVLVTQQYAVLYAGGVEKVRIATSKFRGSAQVGLVLGNFSGTTPSGRVTNLQVDTLDPSRVDRELMRNPATYLFANSQYTGGTTADAWYTKAGPSAIVKISASSYYALVEEIGTTKNIDTANQGANDFDTQAGYYTSSDGTTWTRGGQKFTAASFNGGTAPSWMHGETSPGTLLWDGAANLWKCWGHGGNNTGPRQIWYATAPDDGTGKPGTFTLQNSGSAVFSGSGIAGRFDESWVADARVIRVSSTSYVMFYRGVSSGNVHTIGRATSSDGITWTRGTTPCIDLGSSGAWDDAGVLGTGVVIDPDDSTKWHLFYAGDPSGSTGNALGYAVSTDSGATFTKSANNPLLQISAAGLDSADMGDTIGAYLDGRCIRVNYGSDKDTGGGVWFRGKLEAWMPLTPQRARPTGDTSVGSYTTQAGGTSSLYAGMDDPDELVDDTDYAQSPAGPSSSVYIAQLGPLTNPRTRAGVQLKLRAFLDQAVGGSVSLLTELLKADGSSLSTPASWTDTITTSKAAASVFHPLSSAQIAAIPDADWASGLRLKLTATQGTPSAPTFVGASSLQATATNGANIASITPANGSVGDLLLLILQRNDTQAAPTVTNWTNIANLTGTQTGQSVAVYYKWATNTSGASDATGAITFGTSTIARGGIVLRYAGGLGTGDPTGGTNTRNMVASTATTISATNTSSTADNTMAVFLALAVGVRGTNNTTAITNWSGNVISLLTTTVGNDLTFGWSNRTFATAGSYLTPGITWGVNTTTGAGAGLLLQIKPVANASKVQVSFADLELGGGINVSPPPFPNLIPRLRRLTRRRIYPR